MEKRYRKYRRRKTKSYMDRLGLTSDDKGRIAVKSSFHNPSLGLTKIFGDKLKEVGRIKPVKKIDPKGIQIPELTTIEQRRFRIANEIRKGALWKYSGFLMGIMTYGKPMTESQMDQAEKVIKAIKTNMAKRMGKLGK